MEQLAERVVDANPMDPQSRQDHERERDEDSGPWPTKRDERQPLGAECDAKPTSVRNGAPNNEVLRIQSPLPWSAIVTRSMSESSARGACIGAQELSPSMKNN